MIEKLYYLFYKVVKTRGGNDQSFFKAYIGFCFLIYMNLASTLGLINYFFKYRISKDTSIYGGLFVFGIILLYNYFSLWVRNEEIIAKYENLSNKNGKLLIWSFIILSFSFFYIVLENFVEYHPS